MPGTSLQQPPISESYRSGTAAYQCSADSAPGRNSFPAFLSAQALTFLRRAGADPSAHAQGLLRLTAAMSALPPGSGRGSPTAPTRRQGAMVYQVAFRWGGVDSGFLLSARPLRRRGAPRHNHPLRPPKKSLGSLLSPAHAPPGGLYVGAPGPKAGAAPPHASEHTSSWTRVAHGGGEQPPSPPCARSAPKGTFGPTFTW